ncbi:hypothetical protein TNIN_412341 [Trichonephila inaurata madagascariensis]|uniref:BTB domain-containing protein n=1 Tax=Trichonephila inaurata madagascariensis TaxID=2747483 RepID=A0A8X7C3X7_9ARAC|nr:hypothetical protein TNIN_412341 [Trichonephila inaurata madagascariensis]
MFLVRRICTKRAIKKIDLGITIASVYNQITSEPNASHTEVKELDKMVDLKEDFHCLYDESILTDVKLRTATQTFQAHKNILSARSPVFRAMFMTDMKEKIQESVDLPDLEDDTVRRMLLYMYTNALDGLQFKSALKLYAAADKYEITALKTSVLPFEKICVPTTCVMCWFFLTCTLTMA